MWGAWLQGSHIILKRVIRIGVKIGCRDWLAFARDISRKPMLGDCQKKELPKLACEVIRDISRKMLEEYLRGLVA